MLIIAPLQSDQIPEARRLLTEYFDWAFTLDAGSKTAPTFHGVEEELETLPGKYAPPRGQFLLATLDRTAVGCVAYRPIDEATAELKRLYVSPRGRGHGLGRSLVARLVEDAREAGYRRMVLDSHYTMEHAHWVYRSEGFVDVDPPPGFPEEFKPIVVFMERPLG